MRILVFRPYEGNREAILIAARHAHLAPITIRGKDPTTFREELGTAINMITLREVGRATEPGS